MVTQALRRGLKAPPVMKIMRRALSRGGGIAGHALWFGQPCNGSRGKRESRTAEQSHFFGRITPKTYLVGVKKRFALAFTLSLVTRLAIASTSETTLKLSPK